MKAFEITGTGGIESLRIADRPERQPGPGEVAVRMRGSSVNYRDLGNVLDPQGRGIQTPFIPNSDGAGDVEAVGPGVTRFSPGDKVITCFMQHWIDGTMTRAATDSALGGALEGVLCERAILHEDGLVHLPEHLTYEEGATLTCAGLTAWQAVVDIGNVKAGDTVLLLGTGGVSIFALQFAKLNGAQVIITSSSDEKLARTRALGADETINYSTHPDWDKKVMEITGGRGADQVVEVGGIGTLQKSAQSLAFGGTITMIGGLTGRNGDFTTQTLTRKAGSLHGIYVGNRSMFEAMNRAIAHHRLHPVIDSVYKFENAPAAYSAMQAAGHFGKLAISIE